MKYLIRTSTFGKRYLAAFFVVLAISFTVTPAVIMADEVATTSPDAPVIDPGTPSDATTSDTTVTATTTDTTTDSTDSATTTDAAAPAATTTDAIITDASASSTPDTAATSTSATSTATAIDTGEALTTTDVSNVANTNIVNSTGTIQFITSTSTAPGDLDLSHVLDNLPASSGTGISAPSAPIPNASTTVISTSDAVINTNVSTTTNDISLTASSGDNIITNASGTASITTGTSTAMASLVNLVNTNIIDSNYLMFFVTKIGDLIGNILLPSFDALANFFALQGDDSPLVMNGSGTTDITATTTIDNTNRAAIENNIALGANTGGNLAIGSSTSISTGNALTDAAVVNMANTNVIGAPAFGLMLNVLGTWSGSIVGLPDFITASTTDHGVMLYFFPELRNASSSSTLPAAFGGGVLSDADLISNNNNAVITNNVNLLADTGGNTLRGDGTITTGNADASACIVNVANTNIVRANFFMGMICVLGNFLGDVSFGSTTSPGTPTSTPPVDTGGTGTTTPPDTGGGGGGGGGGGSALMITKTNSATGFVSPGDTITYTVVVSNNLSQPINNGHVVDELRTPDGTVIATNSWDLGTITPNEQITLHYDVTFADDAPGGVYDNHAVVTGTIDSVPLSSSADSTVTIAPFGVGGGGGSPGGDTNGTGGSGGGGGGGVNGDSANASLPGGAGVNGSLGDLPGPPNTGFAPSSNF
jgi:hypothetical protein